MGQLSAPNPLIASPALRQDGSTTHRKRNTDSLKAFEKKYVNEQSPFASLIRH